jgi:hypothetical protein
MPVTRSARTGTHHLDSRGAGHVRSVSPSTVGEVLDEAEIRSHRVKAWGQSHDPKFQIKTRAIAMLHTRRPSRQPVLCVDEMTSGLIARAHGENLIIGSVEETDAGTGCRDDPVRLTRLSPQAWGLSVKRHTGRWERTASSGTLDEMVHTVGSVMLHLVAPCCTLLGCTETDRTQH